MKTILALSSVGLFAAMVALALADCTVVPDESCLTGPCELPTTSSTSSGAGGGGACKNPATGDYPCAVYDILHRKCHVCHATSQLAVSGAPFSLLTWEDSQLPFIPGQPKPRYTEMSEVIAPGGSPQMPFGCSADCPPSGDLSATERATLETWLTTCAVPIPEGMDQKCTQMCGTSPCVPQ